MTDPIPDNELLGPLDLRLDTSPINLEWVQELLGPLDLRLDTSPILPDLGPFCSHCGGDRGARQPCDSDGLGCLENIYHFEDQEQL